MPASVTVAVDPAATPIVVDVNRGGTFRNLSDAIRQAPAGRLLVVRPGKYEEIEPILLDRPIEVRGEGPVKQIVIHLHACFRVAATVRLVGLPLVGRTAAAPNALADCPVHVPSGPPILEASLLPSSPAPS